jgi:hypothetical protein
MTQPPEPLTYDFENFQAGAIAIGDMERAVTRSRKILLVLTPHLNMWNGYGQS